MTINGFPILHYSRTQAVITQSTCEAELLALNEGAKEGKLLQHIFQEYGIDVNWVLATDSSSAKATTLR
eukprot:12630191-Heterocapsa_arctica.AAC.1